MFGYFRPFAAITNSAQKCAFSTHYCRLCYCLRSLGGQKARAFTTFDATVYGMIYSISTNQQSPPSLPCQRISKTNMRKFSSDELGMKFARISLIAFGEKLRDDEIDGDKAFRTGLANLFYGKMIREAEAAEPQITQISRNGTNLVNELQAKGADIRAVLGAYGNSVANVFSAIGEMPEYARELIRAVAEWTFFVDMLCDYDEDMEDGSPNTLHTEGCPTLKDYFDNNYEFLLSENKRITDDIMPRLIELNDNTNDWRALYHIITYALDTVIPNLIAGGDIKFHYLRELDKNRKEVTRQNKRRKKLYGE